ncbi:MAG: glycosyltransferase family 39 protein [Bacteroidetes bacterium]|nr:glycosyltransferase family 39 protein [Bacteroidota bacterium]
MELIKSKNFYFLIASIFIVNFLFKLIYIASPCLWYDEIISAKDTLLDFGHIKHEAEWDKNPPFYHYLLWMWSKLFGISEIGLRSMSVFFSSLTAILIFIFVFKISTKVNALLAVAIFTFHPYLYYFGQEARCYSLLIFLITLNLLVIYNLATKQRLTTALFLGVLNFLIFYTHYVAGLILAFQFLYMTFVFRKKLIYILLIYGTPILLVLLRFTRKQYDVLFFSNKMSQEKRNVPLSDWDTLKESISPLFISWVVLVGSLVFLLVFVVKKMNKRNIENDTLFYFKLYIVFSPLLCFISLFGLGKLTNVFHERYLIFTIPYFIISIFIILNQTVALYIFVILILGFEIKNIKFNQSRKMDYKFCALLAKEVQKKEEINIVVQTQDVISLFIYYYDIEMFIAKNSGNKEKLAERKIYYIEDYSELINLKLDKKPVLFYQTYQRKEDDIKIHNFFKDSKYNSGSVLGIEGVKCTYFIKPTE